MKSFLALGKHSRINTCASRGHLLGTKSTEGNKHALKPSASHIYVYVYMYISTSSSLTFTKKKDTPYVLRDRASFTYFTFASISVISPQLLCSYESERGHFKKEKKKCTTDPQIRLNMLFSRVMKPSAH